jgi:hypothetical protein
VGIVDRTAHCNSNFRLGDADAVILSEPGDGQIIVRPVSIKCRQVIWGDFFVPVRLTVRYVFEGVIWVLLFWLALLSQTRKGRKQFV